MSFLQADSFMGWHGWRSGIGLALIALSAGACFNLRGCDSIFQSCDGDSDCGPGEICDDSFGRSCVPATECVDNTDCPSDAVCVQRPDVAGDNPFEAVSAGKKVCNCGSECFGFGGNGGFGGFGGQGGFGGHGGSGGSGVGGGTPDGGVDAGEGGAP